MFENLCRLCLGTEDLMWIYDKKMQDNMSEIIGVTCGVQITKSDTVTQMVCGTCCQIAIKMFKFRTTSIKNDKDLKERCVERVSVSNIKTETETLESSVCHKSSVSKVGPMMKKLKLMPNADRVPVEHQISQKYKFAHPSIKDIVKKYPDIKLPALPLRSHFGPYITLLTNEVDDWYKEKNFSENDIENIKKKASQYATQENSSRRKKRRIETSDDKNTLSVRKQTAQNESTCGEITNKDNEIKVIHEVRITPVKKLNTRATEGAVDKTENGGSNTLLKNSPSLQPSPSRIEKLNAATEDKDKTNADLTTKSNTESFVSVKLPSELSSLLKEKDILKKDDTENTLKLTLKTNLKDDHSKNQLESFKVSETTSRKENKKTENKNNCTSNHRPEKGTVEIKNTEASAVDSSSRGLCDSLVESKKSNLSKSINDILSESKNDQTISNDDITITSILASNEQNIDENIDEGYKKRDFVRSLELAPIDRYNTPDFSSLLSMNKTNKLFRCKICDSHYTSQKELQKHCKRMHSKCPFCSKRFRNMSLREQHIKSECSENNSHVKSIQLRLDLVRVDQIEEIRNKYPYAFEEVKRMEIVNEANNSEDTTDILSARSTSPQSELVPQQSQSLGTSATEQIPSITSELNDILKNLPTSSTEPKFEAARSEKTANSIVEKKDDIDTTVRELENFLENVPSSSSAEQKTTDSPSIFSEDNATALSTGDITSSNPDVICISDDENDISSKTSTEAKTKKRIKITNNEMLKNINLQDNDINLLTKILTESTEQRPVGDNIKIPGLRETSVIDGGTSKLKIFKNLRNHLQHYKIPIEISFSPDLKVQYKLSRAPNQKKPRKDLWGHMVPQDLKLTTGVMTAQSNRSVSYEVPQVTSSVRKTSTVTSTITSSVTARPPKTIIPKIVQNQNICQSNLNRVERQTSVVHRVAQVNKVQETVPSTTNLILTPGGSVINTSQINQTLTTNTAVVLNGTQNMYIAPDSSSYTNIIIALPTGLVTTRENTNITKPPATQSSLPVIQSVTSVSELVTTSTNTSKSTPSVLVPSNNLVQPSIRVKNIKELS